MGCAWSARGAGCALVAWRRVRVVSVETGARWQGGAGCALAAWGRVRVGSVGRARAAGERLLGFGGEEEEQFDGFAWREGLEEAGGHK